MRIAICLVSAALGACAAADPTPEPGGPDVLPGLHVLPKPDNGIQVITPIYHGIAPGTDNEICTWTDAVFDQPTDVKTTRAFQSEPGGHHVVAYYTMNKQPPGTQRVCQDTDMVTFRMLAGGGEGIVNEAPGDLVYRIPAGAQLVLNHHYLNTTDQTLDGQSGINLDYAGPGNWIPSGNLAIVDTTLKVPLGASRETIHCDFDRDFKLWYLIPHMHQWGAKETIDLTQSGVTTRMFDTTWDPSFAFHPPEKRADPAAPMEVHVGDSIDVECDYINDSGMVLPFGFEMCVVFGQFVDDKLEGGRACDHGSWLAF
jgi:hypothetical protein